MGTAKAALAAGAEAAHRGSDSARSSPSRASHPSAWHRGRGGGNGVLSEKVLVALASLRLFREWDSNGTRSSSFSLVTQRVTHVLFTHVWGKCVCRGEEMQDGKVVTRRKAYLGLLGVLCTMNKTCKASAFS